VADIYDVVLQPGDIGHMFTKPEVSPLSEDYREYSLDRKIYTLLAEMEITISPIKSPSSRGGS